jgi:L-alanine-DL-glutamate epimerase-like enolase superfamily enzyme
MSRAISIKVESWPLRQRFAIARGSKISAETICVEIADKGCVGRGEAVPYARYGETPETVTAAIEALIPALEKGMDRAALADALLPGAARNAVDCALWDLQAKQTTTPVWRLAGLSPPHPLTTAYTIVLDDADRMAERAAAVPAYGLLKIKLGGAEGLMADITRLNAIAEARPDAQLVVDVNEGWQAGELARYADRLGQFGVTFFEQPVPQAQEAALGDIDLPFCADESVHDSNDITALPTFYQWVNIKLDKTGGLSEALACIEVARAAQRKIMVGCMVATSLSMAPATLLGQQADLIDLDGPLWLDTDCDNGLAYEGATVYPATQKLWG